MKRKIELLAPGGDIDSIKSAILAGADAVYCGLSKFNARNRAANITFEDLQGILRLAHKNNCEVFLTLNIIIVDNEISALIKLLNKLVNTTIDGIIIQDFGLAYIISKYFPTLKIHASTQLTTHNKGQVQFLSNINAERVNLSRELNISDIKELASVASDNNMLTEVFVHGSYCISFSGICYISSVHGGNSGNRGRCSQPCRDKYVTTPAGIEYPLNMKDNSAYFDFKKLYDAGVYSLKIEGRIKEFEYVYTVVNSWRKQVDSFYNTNNLINDNSELHTVFNRDFSNAFLKGDIGKDMFIDDPRSQSTKRLSEINNYKTAEEEQKRQAEHFKKKDKIKLYIENEIAQMDISKIPLEITLSGTCGNPLLVFVKTPDSSFNISSKANLTNKGTEAINREMVLKTFNPIKDTEYYIENLELNIDTELHLSFKEINSIKKQLLFILNGSKNAINPVDIPPLKRHFNKNKPSLSVLISSPNDINICNDSSVNLYFELPNNVGNRKDEFIKLFRDNNQLIPWVPSILIGEEYNHAVDLLTQLQPKQIVTNNTGIAFEAYKQGIKWIAGPHLNISNSYSLVNLKENFNCYGSFISNEISKFQIKGIKKPDDFELYFSIYHPIILMTSRQCFFHQVTGCEKNVIDDSCIQKCEKYSTITNLKNDNLIIEKSKGNFHNIYNAANLLNTDIVNDIPNLFSSMFIDLRDIKTETTIDISKTELIDLFRQHINGDSSATDKIGNLIHSYNNNQYKKGI